MNAKKILAAGSCLCLLSGCFGEYLEHNYPDESIHMSSALGSGAFEVSKLQRRDFEMFTFPQKDGSATICEILSKARKRIFLEVYLLTDPDIIDSLVKAKSRGISVRVILEKNVYSVGNPNLKTMDRLVSAGIDARYSDGYDYVFTHSKFIIVDHEYLISTGNMTKAAFSENKDIVLKGGDSGDLRILEQVFDADFNGRKFLFCDATIIVSPKCPRETFEKILRSSKRSIRIYAEAFDDERLKQILKERRSQGVDVRIIVGHPSKIKGNARLIEELAREGIDVTAPKKPFIHAKMIIIDERVISIGSINLTQNSIENNREVGAVFISDALAKRLEEDFRSVRSRAQD